MNKLIIAVLATSGAMIVHVQAETAKGPGRAGEFRTEMRALIRGDGMDVAALANLMLERSQARFAELDADGDGTVTREEALAGAEERATARFARMDRNEDGIVKRSDREGFGRRGGRDGKSGLSEEERAERRSERAERQFSRLDSDEDGMLSPQEFEAGMEKRAERREQRTERREERRERMPQEMRDMHAQLRGLMREGMNLEAFSGVMQELASARFDGRDADGNGELSEAEFTANVSERAERRFARMDRNEDGLVTREDRPHRGKHRGVHDEEPSDEQPEE